MDNNNKDWTGNSNSIYKTLGASSHTDTERELNDYYATDPKAAELLLEVEIFEHGILEPACGEGHLSEVFKKAGYMVNSFDIVDRGYWGVSDFLKFDTDTPYDIDIITNPPYKYATEFIEKALSIVTPGCKVAMFLKVQFLEGKARKKLFSKYPPKVVYISSSRIECALNGKFNGTSAVAYAWFVWVKDYEGDTVIKWIN
jgi:hypothetical protein